MNESDEKLLLEIIAQSGEMWMQTDNRADPLAIPVIICRDPERAYYLRRADVLAGNAPRVNGWSVEERPLSMTDAASFFAAFGSHWYYLLNAIFRGLPIRAFIKNGRSRNWLISQNVKTEPLSVANSIGALTDSLTTFQHSIEQASESAIDKT